LALESTTASSEAVLLEVIRGGELRVQSFSYVLNVLAVLTVVHTKRNRAVRVISFRRASSEEREVYREWLEDTD
jgi:uncharacterized DUF497 family protein